jgi:hypothetical protein
MNEITQKKTEKDYGKKWMQMRTTSSNSQQLKKKRSAD